jgi:hypothetical protein
MIRTYGPEQKRSPVHQWHRAELRCQTQSIPQADRGRFGIGLSGLQHRGALDNECFGCEALVALPLRQIVDSPKFLEGHRRGPHQRGSEFDIGPRPQVQGSHTEGFRFRFHLSKGRKGFGVARLP